MSFIPVNEPLLDGNEKKYLLECIDTGWISSEGPFIKKFEDGVAAKVGRKHGIAVCNGTAALDIAVAALDLKPGDEVILPAFTIISCIGEIVRAGARPVLVDSDPVTWNMDIGQIAEKITARTRAILVVHIYGLPVDMDPVLELASRHGLAIIEDAAEMHGQTYKGRPCGSFGDLSIFSFYPNKHITTGEGGMVLADDEALAEGCRGLRNLCFAPPRRFVHERLGWNYRMTNMQAALGVAQLERLDSFVARKRAMGRRYTEALSSLQSVQLPLPATNYAENIYWVYGMVLNDDVPFDAIEAMKRLAARGVGTRPFFYPMHHQPVFERMGLFAGETYPVAERLADRGFYIPSGMALTEAQIDQVAATVREVLGVSAFDLYSQYYDLLYRDKDYRGEASYVTSLARKFHPTAKTLLDLGCGTGKHASLFQDAGYAVDGVDLSPTMLARARERFPALSVHQGDARTVRLGKRFDIVTSLFHVASYQTSDTDLSDYLATAHAHLAPDGIFIFDFWYGPGVEANPPMVRVKRLADDKIKVTRIAEPTIHAERHVVDVHYDVLVRPQGSDRVQEITEDHAMRYFFDTELETALSARGLKMLAMLEWLSQEPPTPHSWNACIVAGRP